MIVFLNSVDLEGSGEVRMPQGRRQESGFVRDQAKPTASHGLEHVKDLQQLKPAQPYSTAKPQPKTNMNAKSA